MKTLLFIVQQVDIEEKLKNAPDDNYAIGVFIGEMLPFVILVGVAYFIYYKAKKAKKFDGD